MTALDGIITVHRIYGEIPLDPETEIWNSLKPEKVHLQPQTARVPYGNEEREMLVRAVYNEEEIAFLLEYRDTTVNWGLPANPDGCAILFVPGDSPATAQMMGFNSTANIWHWLADRNYKRYREGDTTVNVIRELIAHGPGTQTPMTQQLVEGKGEYTGDGWRVVIKRRLKKIQPDELDLVPGEEFKVAFAIWDGQLVESFSRKSISILRKLVWEK
jgi:DMSO reductase family type II enzyme heme b subunit